MHADLIKNLERRGAELDLSPADLWQMAEIDRTVWQRLRRGVRKAGLPNHLKLEALKGKLDAMPAPKPKRRRAA